MSHIKNIFLFWILVLTLQSFAQATVEPAWPTEEWQKKSPKAAGFDERRFDLFLRHAFAKQLTFTTDSVVVIKDGYLVYEGHTSDYKRDQKHAIWSLGKTMMNAVIGVMEQQGRLHRDDLVRKYYPAVDQAGPKNITIRQLMNMSSGIHWIEEDKEDLLRSDSWDAFYTRESYADMAAYAAKRPLDHREGTKFNYAAGDSALLSKVMRGALGSSEYLDFPWKQLFLKLGMNSVSMERDGSGTFAFQGLGYASPLDLARLGLLYLRKGKVDGQQLWPADWVDFSATMAPSQKNHSDPKDRNLQNNQAYGAQIWLNKMRPEDKELPYPELPANALIGTGTRGQVLLILPSENLVFIRTATDTELEIKKRKEYRRNLFKLLYYSLPGVLQ